jgi:hypothetical protein
VTYYTFDLYECQRQSCIRLTPDGRIEAVGSLGRVGGVDVVGVVPHEHVVELDDVDDGAGDAEDDEHEDDHEQHPEISRIRIALILSRKSKI